jgi:hypothetical protein
LYLSHVGTPTFLKFASTTASFRVVFKHHNKEESFQAIQGIISEEASNLTMSAYITPARKQNRSKRRPSPPKSRAKAVDLVSGPHFIVLIRPLSWRDFELGTRLLSIHLFDINYFLCILPLFPNS